MTKSETRDNLKTLEAEWMDKRETLFMYRAYSADGEIPGTRNAMDQVIKQEADASKSYHDAIDELIDKGES